MKKTMLLVFVVCVISAPLFAGGGQEDQSGASGSQEVPTITIVNLNTGPTDPDSPITLEIEEMFGVDIEYVYLERSNITELLNLRIASGEIPDVMFAFREQLVDFAADGVLRQLDLDMIEEVAPTLVKLGGEIMEGLGFDADQTFTLFSPDGQPYLVPSFSEGGNYHMTLMWRGEWLEAAGVDAPPRNLEEAEELWYAFVNDDPDGNGRDDTYAMSTFGLYAVFGAFGGQPIRDFYWSVRDGEMIADAVIPEMRDALARLNRYYDDGLIEPEFVTGEERGQSWWSSPPFWNGQIGFSANAAWYHVDPPGVWRNQGGPHWSNLRAVQGDDAYLVVGKPLIGPEGLSGNLHWSPIAGQAIGFGRDITDLEMRKYFEITERYLTDEDFYRFISFGVEGEHFEYFNGAPALKEGITTAWLGLKVDGVRLTIPNFDLFRRVERNAAVTDFAMEYAAATPGNWSNDLLTTLPSQAELEGELRSLRTENYYSFITGERPLSEWDEFVDEMMDAGLRQLTVEANEWYQQLD